MLAVPGAGAGNEEPGQLINSDMSGRDLEFLTTVVNSGRAQAYFIDLLHTRASSDEIKKLAENLSIAQEDEDKRIANLAAKKGWNVSMAPTPELKKAGAELEKLQASNFDKAAMDKLVAANQASLAALQSAAESTDPDIKTFAAQMLPLAEEKEHVVEKMTGAGSKAAAQLFRHSAAPGASGDHSAPKSAPAAAEPPADSSTPAATPAVTPKPTKSGRKGKGTPKSAPPPTPASATAPSLSGLPRHTPPPGVSPANAEDSIVPLKVAIPTPSTPAPVPSTFSLPVATPSPTLK
ncbi:MAG TPA: DUF4142 domain-containing protein [Chthoniobacter sp.]|jgi:predicted outer membrane protein